LIAPPVITPPVVAPPVVAPPVIAVIGGGPAGLMAAEVLAAAGQAVTIYDRMPSLGRKFLLAGRGGLNLTHSEPLDRFLIRYGPARPAIAPAIEGFPPDSMRAWCEGLGQETFIGSSGRVFPRTFKASPLLRAWLRRLGGLGVQVRTGHRFVGWDDDALRFDTAGGPVLLPADATVLALGGASWPRLGSDGGWVPVLEAAGAAVAPLRPANAGFLHAWSDHVGRFAGEPLKRIAASFAGRSVRGEAIITADGIEGGAIYALSATLRDAIAARGEATIMLDLRPDLDPAALAARLGGPGVSMSNALRRAGLSPAAASLVREVPSNLPLAERVKALPLRLTGMRPIDRAISTAGGVRFAALEGAMLRTRPGVFVAGEMLDWEAPTGGYLLQACFATGRAAGLQALEWLGR
jgi:uncharacterized flavoprotein (TIGR03862 family)